MKLKLNLYIEGLYIVYRVLEQHSSITQPKNTGRIEMEFESSNGVRVFSETKPALLTNADNQKLDVYIRGRDEKEDNTLVTVGPFENELEAVKVKDEILFALQEFSNRNYFSNSSAPIRSALNTYEF